MEVASTKEQVKQVQQQMLALQAETNAKLQAILEALGRPDHERDSELYAQPAALR